MEWLAQNWIWIAFVVGMLLLMRRGGMACGMGGGHTHRGDMPNHQQEKGDGGQVDAARQPKDPVSGEAVNAETAPNSLYRGRVYYFASRENRDTFEASPAQYASAGGEPMGEQRHHRHGC